MFHSPNYAEESFDCADSARWAADYVGALPQLLRASSEWNKAEGLAEFGIACANRQGPFLVLDRQVELEGHWDSRVD